MASRRSLGGAHLHSLGDPFARDGPRRMGCRPAQARPPRGVRGARSAPGPGSPAGAARLPARLRLRRHGRGAPGVRDRAPGVAARLARGHGGRRSRRRPLRPLGRVAGVRAVAVDLDALGDTPAPWRDFLVDAARRFASIAPLDPDALPDDRAAAAAELDRWAAGGVGDWRGALERFAEDRAPVYLRPSAEAASALRSLAVAGVRVGVYTDAPEPLARVALAHLGATRRVEAVECGEDACARLVERLGGGTEVAATRDDLLRLARDAA